MIKRTKNGFSVDVSAGGSRVRRVFQTKDEAVAWSQSIESGLSAGRDLADAASDADGCGWTMAKLRDATEARYWKNSKNEKTAVINADAVVEMIGPDRHPASLKATDIDSLIERMTADGASAATINRKLSALSRMLNYGVSRGIISAGPKIERLKESTGRTRWYSRDEEARVLNWCAANDPSLGDLVVILADTGARLSEALSLDVCRDTDDVYVRFNETKSGKPRAVPMTTRVKDALKRGVPFSCPRQAQRAWDKCRTAVGLTHKEDVLHGWRHTCASRLVQAGVQIQVVQQWLGHSSLLVTQRYAHLSPHNMLAGLAALGSSSDFSQRQPIGVML